MYIKYFFKRFFYRFLSPNRSRYSLPPPLPRSYFSKQRVPTPVYGEICVNPMLLMRTRDSIIIIIIIIVRYRWLYEVTGVITTTRHRGAPAAVEAVVDGRPVGRYRYSVGGGVDTRGVLRRTRRGAGDLGHRTGELRRTFTRRRRNIPLAP